MKTRKAVGIVSDTEPKKYEMKCVNKMQPCEVCVIDDQKTNINNGHIIMRTASTTKFEVIDLTELSEDACWGNDSSFNVRPYEGDTITLKIK